MPPLFTNLIMWNLNKLANEQNNKFSEKYFKIGFALKTQETIIMEISFNAVKIEEKLKLLVEDLSLLLMEVH